MMKKVKVAVQSYGSAWNLAEMIENATLLAGPEHAKSLCVEVFQHYDDCLLGVYYERDETQQETLDRLTAKENAKQKPAWLREMK